MGTIHPTENLSAVGEGAGVLGMDLLEPLMKYGMIEKMECVLLQTTYKKNANNINFNLNNKFLKE